MSDVVHVVAMAWDKKLEHQLEDEFETTADCILTDRGLAQSSPRLLSPAAKQILRSIHYRDLWLLVRAPPLSGKSVTVAALEQLVHVVAHGFTLFVVTCRDHENKGLVRVATKRGISAYREITADQLVSEIESKLRRTKDDVILLMDDCSNWYSYDAFGDELTRLKRWMPRFSLAGFAVSRYFSAKMKAKGTWPEVWRESQCIGLESLKVHLNADETQQSRIDRFRRGLNQGLGKNGCMLVDASPEGERRWNLALYHTDGHLGHLVMLLLESKLCKDFPTFCLAEYPNSTKRSRGGCNWDNLSQAARKYLKNVALRHKAGVQWTIDKGCDDQVKQLVCEGLLCYGASGSATWSCPLLKTAALCAIAADDMPRAMTRCYADGDTVTLRDAVNAVFASATVADWCAIKEAQSRDKAIWKREKLVAKYEAVYHLYLHSALARISTRDQILTPELPVHYHDTVVGRADAWIDDNDRIGWEDLVGDHHTVNGHHKLKEHCERWLDKSKYGLLNFNAAVTCAYMARRPDKVVLDWASCWNKANMEKNVAVLFIIAEEEFSCISVLVPFYQKNAVEIHVGSGVAPKVEKMVPWTISQQLVGRQNTVNVGTTKRPRTDSASGKPKHARKNETGAAVQACIGGVLCASERFSALLLKTTSPQMLKRDGFCVHRRGPRRNLHAQRYRFACPVPVRPRWVV